MPLRNLTLVVLLFVPGALACWGDGGRAYSTLTLNILGTALNFACSATLVCTAFPFKRFIKTTIICPLLIFIFSFFVMLKGIFICFSA